MSSAGAHTAENIEKAKQIRFEAGAWVERQDGCVLSESEQAEFEAWLGQSMSHRVAYWRADAAWSSADRIKIMRSAEFSAARVEHNSVLPVLAKAAAALILVAALAGGAAFYFRAPADRTYATAVGGRELVSFSDGTRIELNTNTKMRARMTTSERTVWLDHGEAYFQVEHDSHRPFVVMVAGHRITDLGTKFLVRADAGQLEIALTQGRARLDTEDAWIQKHSALLAPGDVVVATANSISRTRESTKQIANALSWKRGLLVFYRTPLADAAYQINRYNQEKVLIADTSLNALPISGTLSANDPEQFARVLQKIFGLKTEKRGGEILISR
jgi:transmembrane sensor